MAGSDEIQGFSDAYWPESLGNGRDTDGFLFRVGIGVAFVELQEKTVGCIVVKTGSEFRNVRSLQRGSMVIDDIARSGAAEKTFHVSLG